MYNNKQNARQSVSKQLKKQKLQKKTPEGYHRMPNGKLMKGSTHSK